MARETSPGRSFASLRLPTFVGLASALLIVPALAVAPGFASVAPASAGPAPAAPSAGTTIDPQPVAGPVAPAPLHLALSKSAPAADEVVERPAEIRLWFTQEPQEGSTSIRLVDAGGELVPLGDVTPSPEDGTVFSAAVDQPLEPAGYTVSWRAMAADGHVVRGEFSFTVRSASAER